MQAIITEEGLRPYYLQFSTDTPHAWEVTEDKRWDFVLKLFMPDHGDMRLDAKLIAEFEQYLVKNWGYVVLDILRDTTACGTDTVEELTFRVKDPHKDQLQEDQHRPDNTQLSVLRQIANVRHTAAGIVEIEKLTLDDEVIAHKAVYTVTDGEPTIEQNYTDGDRCFTVKSPCAHQYTCFVQGIGDQNNDPQYTAGWLANELGLFLLKPISGSTTTRLHRESKACGSTR